MLTEIASAVREIQHGLNSETANIGDPVLNLTDTQWSGDTRTAADIRAESETRWLRTLSDKFGDLATNLEDAVSDIRSAIDVLKATKGDADEAGYVLRTDDPGYTVNFDSELAPEGAEFDQESADYWRWRLSSQAADADTAVTSAGTAIAGGLTSISNLTPASLAQNSMTIDPQEAQSDANAVMNGTATPEQRARFDNAMTLTPDQLSALNRGEPIFVPEAQLQYIAHATGAIDVGNGRVSGIGSFDQFGTRPGEAGLRKSLANGLQILSNPNVKSNGNGPHDKGGFDLLPQSIKDSLTREDLAESGDYGRFWLNGVNDNQAIGRLLQAGDSRYQTGTDLDKRMIEVGRQYLDLQTRYEQETTDGFRNFFVDGQQVEDPGNITEDIFAGAGPDDIAVNASLTNPDSGQDFIHDLLTHEWTDDGKAAAALLTTDANDATVEDPSNLNDAFTARKTGETMEAVAKYMASNDGWSTLSDMPGLGGQSVGQVNPELLRTISESMSPYILELAGGNTPNTPGFDPDDSWTDPGKTANTGHYAGTANIFAAMNTDEEAGTNFMGHAIDDMWNEEGKYGEDPNAKGSGAHLTNIGNLHGLIDKSTMMATQDAYDDEYDENLKAWEMKGKAFDFAADIAGIGIDKVPGSELAEPGINHERELLKSSLIGDAPTHQEAGLSGPNFDEIRYNVAQQIPPEVFRDIAPDFVVKYGDWFDPNGYLLPLETIRDLRGADGEILYGDSDVSSGLSAAIRTIDTSPHSDNTDINIAYDKIVKDQGAETPSEREPR